MDGRWLVERDDVWPWCLRCRAGCALHGLADVGGADVAELVNADPVDGGQEAEGA